MKKNILSLIVIGTFFFYSLYMKNSTQSINNSVNQKSTSDNSSNSSTGSSNTNTGIYKDGEYTGNVANAFYGYIQVKAVVSGGKLSDVQFLQYPNDRHESVEINTDAMPVLQSEAIHAQNANVDIVSGATDTSKAFIESLNSALNQAKS